MGNLVPVAVVESRIAGWPVASVQSPNRGDLDTVFWVSLGPWDAVGRAARRLFSGGVRWTTGTLELQSTRLSPWLLILLGMVARLAGGSSAGASIKLS